MRPSTGFAPSPHPSDGARRSRGARAVFGRLSEILALRYKLSEASGSISAICLIGVGRSQLARRLSSPPFECMSECAHLMKAEQPRNLRYMHLAVVEVTNRQIAPELLKYLTVVQPFVRQLSCKRPLAHSETASHVIHEHPSMRKHRRDRVLDARTQLAYAVSSIG